MAKHEEWELSQMQSLPLEAKIIKTQQRIKEFVDVFGSDGVYVSFSGGKDSTVLLDIVRSVYPDVLAVFADTGLEYPEIRQFARSFDNVEVVRPKLRFDQVIKQYGYPVISKEVSNAIYYAKKGSKLAVNKMNGIGANGVVYEKDVNMYCKYKPLVDSNIPISSNCCKCMKEAPLKSFERKNGKHPITGMTAAESNRRKLTWLKYGCNIFEGKSIKSNPLMFWTDQDILQYIVAKKLPIASVYGEVIEYNGKLKTTGCDRTGCIFCAFGAHRDRQPRFVRLKKTHPKQYEYCIGGGEYDENDMWVPNKDGLGMGHVFDEMNKLYGFNFIKYE